ARLSSPTATVRPRRRRRPALPPPPATHATSTRPDAGQRQLAATPAVPPPRSPSARPALSSSRALPPQGRATAAVRDPPDRATGGVCLAPGEGVPIANG